MTALVTGATGFVGAAVVRALATTGTEVRVLVRRGSDLRNLAGLKVEQAHGDLRDRDSLRATIQTLSCYSRHVVIEIPNLQRTRKVKVMLHAAGTR